MNEEYGEQRITYKYTRHPDYRIFYANGAVGGTTPRGDIKFDLFIEFMDVPEETSHSVTPDGLGPEVERKPMNPPFNRQSQMGVIMNPNQAKSLGYWLLNQVKVLEEKQKGGGHRES